MGLILRTLSLSLLLVASLAFGQSSTGPSYEVVYSGGQWSSSGPTSSASGSYSGLPFGISVGTGGIEGANGLGSASCSGQIVATFTWNNAGNLQICHHRS